jgi:putative FmdB family regulatory protein
MAVYEYRCPKCRNQFELMRPMSEAAKPATCPKCGSRAERMISGFGSKTGSYLQPTEKPFRQKVAVSTAKGAAKPKTSARTAKGAVKPKTAAKSAASPARRKTTAKSAAGTRKRGRK